MRWVLRLIAISDASRRESADLMEIYRPAGVGTIADLGLTLSDAKQLLRRVQQAVVAAQTDEHGRHRPDCLACRGGCQVKDWRSRRVATLFGEVVVRLPRFICAVCNHIATGIDWPRHTRSTPELQQLRAHLSAMNAVSRCRQHTAAPAAN
jgi:hypothetical protein